MTDGVTFEAGGEQTVGEMLMGFVEMCKESGKLLEEGEG